MLATAIAALCVDQLEFGVATGVLRIQAFGAIAYDPIPTATLDAISDLPRGSRLAYACYTFEEFAFWDARLISINAHTGQRVVPMCFQADVTSAAFFDGERSEELPNPFFHWAPQRVLYPNVEARPSASAVAAFLKQHGIHFIYADPFHPNTLVPDAPLLTAYGDWQVFRVP
jgi:hypothetical protein